MWYYYLLYFFVAVGAKLLLAMAMIYLLLPAGSRCGQCDGETLLMRPGVVGRMGVRMCRGRLQRRWCPGCRWEGLTRRARNDPPPAPSRRRGAPSFKH